MQMKRNSQRPRVNITGDGDGVVSHAGSLLLVEMADRLGLRAALAQATAPTRQRRSAHDPGSVLVDLAVMLADGGDCLTDLKVLREQPDMFGAVASDATAWRVLDAIDDAAIERIGVARAATRARAWGAGSRPPQIVLDIDATLITAHSEKEHAAPTYKRGFGFHPLLCFLDGTNEALSGILRPGNAGSSTATDHIDVLDQALAQLPVRTTEQDPHAGEPMAGARRLCRLLARLPRCRPRAWRGVLRRVHADRRRACSGAEGAAEAVDPGDHAGSGRDP